MRLALILITAVLQVLCGDLEKCEIFPRNPVVLYGSDLTLFLKAPSSSHCRSMMPFKPSRIYWTLNKKKIDQRFYDFNATFPSVSVRNLSVEKGTVECFLNDTTPVLLHGTFIQTYPRVESPQNVSCIGKMNSDPLCARITCTWDHDKYSTDINYKVILKEKKEHICISQSKNCTFPDDMSIDFRSQLNITVRAQNSHGYSAQSNEVTYFEIWNIVQMDSPEDVVAETVPTGFTVTWKIEQKRWIILQETECELQLHEKGSNTKPVGKIVRCSGTEVTEVKPCTNYTLSVRSRLNDSVWSPWSPWSQGVTALSYINVSSLQFHLWRSKSVLGDRGKRTLHLMWKGVPPSCNAFDKYCISSDSKLLKCIGPYKNHVFITLDEHPHIIAVAAFRDETYLNEASIEVPAIAEEVNLPSVEKTRVFVQNGGIHITWKKPSLPVSGYIIVWNSTAKNHMWKQTLENSFTLTGESSTSYTISVTPLYTDGPGNEITLHNCNQERPLEKVSKVQVTDVSDKCAEIQWLPVLPTQSCAFVLNYSVIYQTINGLKSRNVTVESNQHRVTLRDLQAKTEYSIFVMASTVAASSKSIPVIFSTESNSQLSLIVIIVCCLGLILLPMLSVMIQKKFLSKKIPDPRFSSLSMWPSDKTPWSLFLLPGGRDTEKILPCHVESEVLSLSPTSKKDMAPVKALTDIQNIATHEASSHMEISPLADSFSDKGRPPIGGKEQRVPPVPSLDLQNSGICPPPPIQSPYRKQTPVNSPSELPSKPLWSDETEALLTPKLKNTTYFSSYMTLDMFEPGKHATK